MATPITMSEGGLQVPNDPIIPFIIGDGTGPDIWRASVRVFDAAVEKAYGGTKKVEWKETLAGQKAFDETGNWLPDATLDDFRQYLVGIKGPLTTPVGGGIRSLNVALRQMLDLYVCLRPVQYFKGVPSPVKRPEAVDMVIFRENTEDIYAGIEFAGGHARKRRRCSISWRQNFLEGCSKRSASGSSEQAVVDYMKAAIARRCTAMETITRPRSASASSRSRKVGSHPAHQSRHRLRACDERSEVRHHRAQGEHHEVHGRGLHATGATNRRRAHLWRRSIRGRSGSGRRRRKESLAANDRAEGRDWPPAACW